MKKTQSTFRLASLFSFPAFKHRVFQRVSFLLTAFSIAFTGAFQNASAETVTVLVPTRVIVFQGFQFANGGGQCLNGVYAVWDDEFPGDISATAKYGPNFSASVSGTAPLYHNEGQAQSPGSAGFPPAGAGTNRLEMGWNSAAGPAESEAAFRAQCDQLIQQLKAATGEVANVYVTLTKPSMPRIVSLSGEVTLGSSGTVTIGKLTCPAGGLCYTEAPRGKTVNARIGSKVYRLIVNEPNMVQAGKSAPITVTFPLDAAAALKGRKVTVSIKVYGANHGVVDKAKTIKRVVRRNK